MSELDGQDGCFDEHTPRAAFPTFSVYDKKKSVCEAFTLWRFRFLMLRRTGASKQ